MEALRRCSGVLFVALLFVRLIAASSLQVNGLMNCSGEVILCSVGLAVVWLVHEGISVRDW